MVITSNLIFFWWRLTNPPPPPRKKELKFRGGRGGLKILGAEKVNYYSNISCNSQIKTSPSKNIIYIFFGWDIYLSINTGIEILKSIGISGSIYGVCVCVCVCCRYMEASHAIWNGNVHGYILKTWLNTGITRDKTMPDKLIYIPNDDTEITPSVY